jgi:16S rRNA (cytidine1402-2'-O)-methyltransferase
MSRKKGRLFVIATPIGNLDDITERAVKVLESVDVIAAEDTRHSKKLLQHFGIKTPMIPLHEHNEKRQVPHLIRQLEEGQSIGLISDAGTPLISDPGYRLVQAAHDSGNPPVPVPGPSALAAMLSVAGLPVDHFIFEGFLPARGSARRSHLQNLVAETRSLVFYESSHRIMDSLNDMSEVFGPERQCSVGRELTKKFESLYRDSLQSVLDVLAADEQQQRGEFVVVIQGAEVQDDEGIIEAQRVMDVLCEELPMSQAAALAAKVSGVRKKLLYEYGLGKQE